MTERPEEKSPNDDRPARKRPDKTRIIVESIVVAVLGVVVGRIVQLYTKDDYSPAVIGGVVGGAAGVLVSVMMARKRKG